jgi:hypothetical protein
MRSTACGANQCTGGTVSGDSHLFPDTGAGMALDANASTQWETLGTALPHWWRYRFSAPIDIIEYTIQAGSFSGENPKAWTLEHSGNGIDWTVADTRTGQTGWGATETRTFSFSLPSSVVARPQVFVCT